jgi:DNA repair exonuclease SbcCD ATPase subunit
MEMKITKLIGENIMRMKAFSINPKDGSVIISGKNGAGKSAVLNSILFALTGKESQKLTPKPIREGADEARIRLSISDKYTVDVQYKKGGIRKLYIYNADGTVRKSPQALLDDMIGDLTIDPTEIIQMKPKELKELLLRVTGLEEKIGKLEDDRAKIYDKRTSVGRDIRKGESLLQEYEGVNFSTVPDKEISVSELSMELRNAEKYNQDIDRLRDETDSIRDGIDDWEKKIEEIKKEIALAKEDLMQKEKELKGMKYKDITKMEEDLSKAEDINIKVREKAKYQEGKKQQVNATKEYKKLTNGIKDIDKKKEDLLKNAELPIKGLSVDEEGTVYNGIPYTQISDGEKLRVAMAIAVAKNPDLRVVLIRNGSLLDSSNFKMIEEIADKKDYQVWIEKVDESGDVGIYIEEGEVKKVNE